MAVYDARPVSHGDVKSLIQGGGVPPETAGGLVWYPVAGAPSCRTDILSHGP